MQGGQDLHLQPGTVIAERYEVLRFLGAGGMGSVVLVSDRALQNTQVVLKFLHPKLVPNEQQFLRFQNEVMLMREMNHPNIVRTYDIGRLPNNLYYLSMEYVQGTTLGKLLRDSEQGKLSFSEATKILFEVAAGLAHAHDKGIIHRDLKPDNILVSESGEVKITDFGLGKALEMDLSLTDPGETVGTPYYMAPEQLRGGRSDYRCDIYSFGILTFETLTGKRPFTADNFLELAHQHFKNRIPVFWGKDTGIPKWFQAFVERCAAKSADHRFTSFHEIVEILATNVELDGGPPSRNPLSPVSSRLSQRLRLTLMLLRPQKIFLIIVVIAMIVTVTVTVISGRNNHRLRMKYTPTVLRIEKKLGIKADWLRKMFIEGDAAKYAYLDDQNLIWAVKRGKNRTVELLLAAGANPNILGEAKKPLIFTAIQGRYVDVFELMAANGADLTIEDEARRSILTLAVLSDSKQLVRSVLKYTPRELLRIDDRDSSGKTALLYAIEQKNHAILELLLPAGTSFHVKDNDQRSPLIYAARAGDVHIVEQILNKTGSNGIDYVSSSGKSALMYAAETGAIEVVRRLQQYGANTQLVDSSGKTAVDLATANGHHEVIKYLLELKGDAALLAN